MFATSTIYIFVQQLVALVSASRSKEIKTNIDLDLKAVNFQVNNIFPNEKIKRYLM